MALLCDNRWSVLDHSWIALSDAGVWGAAVRVTTGLGIVTQSPKSFYLLSGTILESLTFAHHSQPFLMLCLGLRISGSFVKGKFEHQPRQEMDSYLWCVCLRVHVCVSVCVIHVGAWVCAHVHTWSR